MQAGPNGVRLGEDALQVLSQQVAQCQKVPPVLTPSGDGAVVAYHNLC